MRRSTSGFTIVELLIVVVVIGILAAISLVAFNNTQARARDNVRYTDAKAIVKALELYKTDNGTYPVTSVTATSSCGAGHTNGYSYSTATDGSWLKPLVDGGYLSKPPSPPNQSCSNYYRYLHPGATSYNCPARTNSYYVLEFVGTDATFLPADASHTLVTWNWRPCVGATAAWGSGATNWSFARDNS
ncbi:MAG: prepilin-type N-terminal cleavage/methylation domain-containing protein [Candidatus Saccharimonadales bacterium]